MRFQHGMAYRNFQISLEEQLLIMFCVIKKFILEKKKYEECQRGLASIIYIFFDKTIFLRMVVLLKVKLYQTNS